MIGPTPFDRLIVLEVGREAVAIRNIPGTLAIFDSHFPRFPVLPGVVLIDSMARLAALALGGSNWTLSGAEVVRFRHFVRPGDEARIAVTVLDGPGPVGLAGTCGATVTVDGRTVATARRLHLVRMPVPEPNPAPESAPAAEGVPA